MNETTFIEAIQAQPAPPCEQFKCFCAKHCAETKAACESFATYVETGRVPQPGRPSPEVYARIYLASRSRRRPGGGRPMGSIKRTED